MIGLFCVAAVGIAYFAATGQLKNLCSPEVVRPSLAVGVLFGMILFILFGTFGVAFLRGLLSLGVIAWIMSWVFWKTPPLIEIIGQVVGWVFIVALIWSLRDSDNAKITCVDTKSLPTAESKLPLT